MIEYNECKDGRLTRSEQRTADVIWFDLVHPSGDEIAEVQEALGISIPSIEDMKEIEVSSRLYREGEANYMTASVVYRIDEPEPVKAEVTFILLPEALVTVRFATPRAFQLFAAQAGNGDVSCKTPAAITIGLIETVIEREADLTERMQQQIEDISQDIFELKRKDYSRAKRYASALKKIGRTSDILSQTRESLVSLGRLLTYFLDVLQKNGAKAPERQRVKSALRDVQSMAAHIDHMSSRLTFLLDATIGLVGIEQNQIIKLFSVVAVMLMPPTLIASVYGMNFQHMPELAHPWGYPVALGAMVVSAVVPFLYFKWKGWL